MPTPYNQHRGKGGIGPLNGGRMDEIEPPFDEIDQVCVRHYDFVKPFRICPGGNQAVYRLAPFVILDFIGTLLKPLRKLATIGRVEPDLTIPGVSQSVLMRIVKPGCFGISNGGGGVQVRLPKEAFFQEGHERSGSAEINISLALEYVGLAHTLTHT